MRKLTSANAIITVVATAVVVLELSAFLMGYRLTAVIGQSMAPTLGDKSIHLALLVDDEYVPQNEDIVGFFPFGEFNDDTLFVKRIVGVAGDTLQAQDGVLTRNGTLVCSHPGIGTWSVEVPDETVFVLGDNYWRSTDSRILGPIPCENIYSKLCMQSSQK